jgi:hypothetical protein
MFHSPPNCLPVIFVVMKPREADMPTMTASVRAVLLWTVTTCRWTFLRNRSSRDCTSSVRIRPAVSDLELAVERDAEVVRLARLLRVLDKDAADFFCDFFTRRDLVFVMHP